MKKINDQTYQRFARRLMKKNKKSCGKGVEERELKRTLVHVSDLGHIPFQEVRGENFSSIKHCRGSKEKEREQKWEAMSENQFFCKNWERKINKKLEHKRRETKKKKAGCGEGVKERELKRTADHVSDLGHVPFREVWVEDFSVTKHCRCSKERRARS